ncbi:MAG: hypothetical protein ACKO8I_15720 [Cyanobacteriota bacterium]
MPWLLRLPLAEPLAWQAFQAKGSPEAIDPNESPSTFLLNSSSNDNGSP